MSRPRIAIVAPYLPIPELPDEGIWKKGGVERYVIQLAGALSKHDLDLTVVTPSKRKAEIETDCYAVRTFPRLKILFGAPVFNPARLLGALDGFDIVHTQATYPLLSDMNPLFARIKDCHSVVTYHFEPVPTSPKERVFSGAYLNTLARMTRRHDRIILSSRSYWESTSLHDEHLLERTRFIPMGVDTDYFVPDTSVKPEERFLFVGRLVPYKDLYLLIRAMEIVNKDLPRHELLIVGTGPLERELRMFAKSKKANVVFIGHASDGQLLKLYQGSTATVLASHDHQEAFGMTLVESMSCGTPAIAADIPGVRDVASVSGTPVDPGSAEALAKAMIDVAQRRTSPSERLRLHERIEELYSWRRVAERTADVYKELLRE